MLCEETIEGTSTNGRRFRLSISPDDFPESPRGWDNLGTFVTWERDYTSPDENPYDSPEDFFDSLARETATGASAVEYWEERALWETGEWGQKCRALYARAVERESERYAIILPVYRYEHSAVAYSTAPFPCRWDSGQVGYIYVSRADALRELGTKILTRAGREKIEGILRAEVAVYSCFANREVYAYTLEEEGEGGEWEVQDTMGGIYDRGGASVQHPGGVPRGGRGGALTP